MKQGRKPGRFTGVLERGEDGSLVGSLPALKGCHTQGTTLDQAVERIREAAEPWVEAQEARRPVPLPS